MKKISFYVIPFPESTTFPICLTAVFVYIYIYATFQVGVRTKFVTQQQKLLLVLLLFDFGLGDLHFLWHHMQVSSTTKHFLPLVMSNMG